MSNLNQNQPSGRLLVERSKKDLSDNRNVENAAQEGIRRDDTIQNANLKKLFRSFTGR